jgi:cysteine dioxygenase
MDSLKTLGDTITNKLKEGEHLRNLTHILESYDATDWQQYIKFDTTRYFKTKVYSNIFIDIFVICWNFTQNSKIHDHPENGCLMRILQGELQEDLYIQNNATYQFIKTNILKKDDITYKEGNCCLHNIISPDKAISLHIYSPPNYKTNYY